MEHTSYPQMHQNPIYTINPNPQNHYQYQNYYYPPQSMHPNPTPPVLDHHHYNYYQQYQDPTLTQHQPVFDPNNSASQYSYNQYTVSHEYTYQQQTYYQNPAGLTGNQSVAVNHYAINTHNLGVNMGTYQANQHQNRLKRKNAIKKTVVVQSAWCDICHIKCDTNDVLELHKQGKKHKKKLENLRTAATANVFKPPSLSLPPAPAPTAAPISASTSGLLVAYAASDVPMIGPQENLNKATKASKKKKRSKASEPLENLETKKKKVVEGGAAAEAVRTCSVCNVVCNSDTVYTYHLAGQKHAAMMKKHAPLATVVAAR